MLVTLKCLHSSTRYQFKQHNQSSTFLGYWSGLIPRAIGELTCVGLTYAIAHIVNAYVLEDKALKAWTQQLASFFASSITYPFQVI